MRSLPTLLVPVLLAALCAPAPARAGADGDSVQGLRPGHPRLLMTDDLLAAALRAAKTDPLRAALHARIVAAAELDLSAPPVVHRLTGIRLLDQSRTAIEHIATCAMAYRLTGDSRFAERARREVLNVSAFDDWNPSHFLDVAEMSFAVGIGYDWLYSYLSPGDRLTIKTALLEKALSFAPAAYGGDSAKDKRLFWVTATMNWNQVCNGGLLTAALALADEEPGIARTVISGVRATLPGAMAAYEPDGAYPEGPAYWDYGTGYNVIILAELEGALGTDFGLGSAPGFRRTALYRLAVQGPTGLAFNYADGGPHIDGSATYTWLAERFGPPAALRHSRELLSREVLRTGRSGDRMLALQAAWFPPPEAEGSHGAEPLDLHFRGRADLAILRGSWDDPGALFVGFKAGDNTTNHSHLDLGSFVMDADGVRWAVNLGSDNYDLPDYFGRKRWTYFRLNNHSQNTLTPGGELQRLKAVAPITAFGSAPARAFAVADLTSAYPDEAAKILRGVALLDRSRVLVLDELTHAREGVTLHWAMVTYARIAVSTDGAAATLSQEGRTLRVEALSPGGARFRVGSTRPPTREENQNWGSSMLVLDVPGPAAPSDLRIAVLLTPVGRRWPVLPAPELAPLPSWR
ncbi:MAG: heparinase II/III family protein [Opitutaceae bacterium]